MGQKMKGSLEDIANGLLPLQSLDRAATTCSTCCPVGGATVPSNLDRQTQTQLPPSAVSQPLRLSWEPLKGLRS